MTNCPQCGGDLKYSERLKRYYCDDCGSTDVIESPLETWKARYRKKYGSDFIRNRQQMFDDSTNSD